MYELTLTAMTVPLDSRKSGFRTRRKSVYRIGQDFMCLPWPEILPYPLLDIMCIFIGNVNKSHMLVSRTCIRNLSFGLVLVSRLV